MPQEYWSFGLVYDARVHGGAGNDDSVLGAYVGRRLNNRLWLNVRAEVASVLQVGGHGITTTLDYQLWSNVISRLEYRWDYTNPAVNGRRDNHGLHLNLIYEF